MPVPSLRMIILTRISTIFNRRKRGLWLNNLSSSSQPGSSCSKRTFTFPNVTLPQRMLSLTISMVLFTTWLRFEEIWKAESRMLRSWQSACKNPVPPYLSTETKDEMAISRREDNTPKSIGQSLISSIPLKMKCTVSSGEKNWIDLQRRALRQLMWTVRASMQLGL